MLTGSFKGVGFGHLLLTLTRIPLINSLWYLGLGWKNLGHLIDTPWYLATLHLKLMIHNLLLELVVLPNVLALALHQVNYFGWMDQGDHFWYQTVLLLKVRVD